MKALTLTSLALALVLASPGEAKDIIEISAGNSPVDPSPRPDFAHLKRGDSSGDVSLLQKALNDHGERLTVDGIFGRQTARAVKDFQAQNGLESTGEVDSGTWSALSSPAPGLEAAKQDARQAKAQAAEYASLLANLDASGDPQTSDSPRQPAQTFKPNEQPPTIYVGTPDTPAIATAHIKVGNILLARGDLAEALKSYRDGLAVAEHLAAAEPENPAWQHKTTQIFLKVGDVLMAQGNFAEALNSYRDAVSLADRFATSDPENADWQRNLSLAYNKTGNALAAGGNLTEALKILQDGLAIRERLAQTDSSNTDAQRDLAISQAQVAAVLTEQRDAARALDLLKQARLIIARLLEQSPNDDQLSKDIAVFDANIAKLEQISAPGAGAAQPEQAVR